jgi:hypothetical protein
VIVVVHAVVLAMGVLPKQPLVQPLFWHAAFLRHRPFVTEELAR